MAAGRWITRRRSILFAPLFTAVLLTARSAVSPAAERFYDLLGLLCLIFGTWLRTLAVSYHESSEEDHPITAGPYAWIRHPLYLANFLLGLGIVLVAGWWPMLFVYAAVFIPLYWTIIQSEEEHLSQRHGKEYDLYLHSVHAVIPWRRYRGGSYGLRNDYKIREGREPLKAAGYAVSAAAALGFKMARSRLEAPIHLLRSLPAPTWLLGAVILSVVVLRPKLQTSFLKNLQTAIVIFCAAVLSLRVTALMR